MTPSSSDLPSSVVEGTLGFIRSLGFMMQRVSNRCAVRDPSIFDRHERPHAQNCGIPCLRCEHHTRVGGALRPATCDVPRPGGRSSLRDGSGHETTILQYEIWKRVSSTLSWLSDLPPIVMF